METTRRRDRRSHLPPVHVRPRHRTDRLHVQPVPHRRRASRPSSTPDHGACSRRVVGGRRLRAAARTPALDHVRPSRSRRMRGDEPLPRGGAERPGRPHRDRLHGVDQRPRRPAPGSDRPRRVLRPRWSAHPKHRHPARAPRLGCPRPLRGDHRHPVLRRPPLPGRRRTGADRRTTSSVPPCRPRTCSGHLASPRRRHPPSAAWPSSSRRRSPSCTVRRTTARPQGTPRPRRRLRAPSGPGHLTLCRARSVSGRPA